MEDAISTDKVLTGVRVLEVAAWTFVPSAGAVLAEWGAEVIKVEPRDGGDPQRGLVTMGIVDAGDDAVNYMIEIPNRGKKSIGVDLSKMNTIGDLQGGLEEAERLLGFSVTRADGSP